MHANGESGKVEQNINKTQGRVHSIAAFTQYSMPLSLTLFGEDDLYLTQYTKAKTTAYKFQLGKILKGMLAQAKVHSLKP